MSYDLYVGDEWFNYTYNMSQFFDDYCVSPKRDLDGLTGRQAYLRIYFALSEILNDYDSDLETRYNSANGWGSVETAFDWLRKVMVACKNHPDEIVKEAS